MEKYLTVFSVFYVFAAMIGLLMGALVRRVSGPSAEGRESTEKLYKLLGRLTLGVVLPIHLFLTLTKTKSLSDAAYLPVMFATGAAATLAILFATWLITRVEPFRGRFGPHFPYIAATFSGGGRSIFLLWALAEAARPLIAAQTAQNGLRHGVHFDMFAMFDIGYWLVFLSIVHAMLMKRTFAGRAEAAQAYDAAKDTNPWPLIVAAGLGVGIQFVQPLKLWLDANLDIYWVDMARGLFAAFIVGLSAMAIALKVQVKNPAAEAGAMAFVVFARTAGLAGPAVVACLVWPQYAAFLLLVAATFVLSPPSSLIDRMLDGRGASAAEVVEAVNLNVAWNLVLLGLAVLTALVGVISQWSPGG